MCLLRNKRYKTYQTGFSFGRLGHALGVGLGGTVGVQWSKNFFSEIQPDLVCELLTSMAHATAQFFGSLPPGALGRGEKRSNIMKSQLQCQFQRFLNQTMCVFSQMKDIKHIRQDFHSVGRVMPQGWDLGVPWGVGGPNCFFSKIQPDLVCELLT